MTRAHGVEKVLEETGEVMGRFAPAGAPSDFAGDPGLLRWSPDAGCELTLLDAHPVWSSMSSHSARIVHGVTTSGGHLLSLTHAWVNQLDFPRSKIVLHSSGLMLGAHIT